MHELVNKLDHVTLSLSACVKLHIEQFPLLVFQVHPSLFEAG
jgi:hypothetical protein